MERDIYQTKGTIFIVSHTMNYILTISYTFKFYLSNSACADATADAACSCTAHARSGSGGAICRTYGAVAPPWSRKYIRPSLVKQ